MRSSTLGGFTAIGCATRANLLGATVISLLVCCAESPGTGGASDTASSERDAESHDVDVIEASQAVDASTPSGKDATPTGPDATSTPKGKVDGGLSQDAAAPDAGNPYNTPPVCTSGMTWTRGTVGSPEMQPGVACDTCHVLGGQASGYEFDLAGTVYPTAHEPNDCSGVSGASIVVTDAKNATHTLAVNAAGNFYNFDYLGVGAIPKPYTVKVVANGQERPMLTPETNGNCNACHTEQGTQGAPGRVMMP